VGGTFRDWAAEQTQHQNHVEERQKLLLDELNHRIRNTLAIIQALLASDRSDLRPTRRRCPTPIG
jgi:two-component sensor histidine kinase